MGSQAIPNGSLAGAMVGVPQTVSWASLNLFTAVGVQNPTTTEAVVELLNVSGSLCRIRFPLSNIQRLLPPTGWIQVSINKSEVSYEFTPLTVAQVAGLNAITGIYYPAGTPPSEIVALGGSSSPGNSSTLAQVLSNETLWNAGTAGPFTATLNVPVGAIAFLTDVLYSGSAHGVKYPIIGKAMTINVNADGGGAFYTMEQVGLFRVPILAPIAGRLISPPSANISFDNGGNSTLAGNLTVIGYYQ